MNCVYHRFNSYKFLQSCCKLHSFSGHEFFFKVSEKSLKSIFIVTGKDDILVFWYMYISYVHFSLSSMIVVQLNNEVQEILCSAKLMISQ